MTDPTGKSFLSYRRARLHEATLLIEAQHDLGIPTWQDIDDLRHEPTEQELERVLADPSMANALVWVTEDVAGSDIIKKVEVPSIHKRHEKKDGFFVVPVAAGKTDYADAPKIIGEFLDIHDFRGWNFEKTKAEWIDVEDAAEIAGAVLDLRVAVIDATLGDGDPFRVGIYTRTRPPGGVGLHLELDWMGRFSGRCAPATTWDRFLVPSLRTVAAALDRQNGNRSVEVSGRACLPALVALGCAFLEPRGIELTWQQFMSASRETQPWSLAAAPQESGLEIKLVPSEAAAQDLAVIVSITTNAHAAVKRGQEEGTVPPFRAVIDVRFPEESDRVLESAGQAADAVLRTIKTLREAQAKYREAGTVHLFLAAPAGYAVMLGQKLNALGPIQTYEHEQTDTIGRYEPAALLRPGA
jgi:hypothetical protein